VSGFTHTLIGIAPAVAAQSGTTLSPPYTAGTYELKLQNAADALFASSITILAQPATSTVPALHHKPKLFGSNRKCKRYKPSGWFTHTLTNRPQ
jgi:hypothetical protein